MPGIFQDQEGSYWGWSKVRGKKNNKKVRLERNEREKDLRVLCTYFGTSISKLESSLQVLKQRSDII